MPYPVPDAKYTRDPNKVYDLTRPEELDAAKQKLNDVGLGRSIVVSPSTSSKAVKRAEGGALDDDELPGDASDAGKNYEPIDDAFNRYVRQVAGDDQKD